MIAYGETYINLKSYDTYQNVSNQEVAKNYYIYTI